MARYTIETKQYSGDWMGTGKTMARSKADALSVMRVEHCKYHTPKRAVNLTTGQVVGSIGVTEEWEAEAARMRAVTFDAFKEAKKYVAAVEPMTTEQLDDWYEEHVGYRLSEDDPSLVGKMEHAAQVAEMMCLHEHGEGEVHDALLSTLVQLGYR